MVMIKEEQEESENEDLEDPKLRNVNLQQIAQEWRAKDLISIPKEQVQLIERVYFKQQKKASKQPSGNNLKPNHSSS